MLWSSAFCGFVSTSALTWSKSASAGAAVVVELTLQVRVLLERRLVPDQLLQQLLVLPAQLRVLGLRVGEAVHPACGVAERPRDTVGADLERPQNAGRGALDAVERGRAERDA